MMRDILVREQIFYNDILCILYLVHLLKHYNRYNMYVYYEMFLHSFFMEQFGRKAILCRKLVRGELQRNRVSLTEVCDQSQISSSVIGVTNFFRDKSRLIEVVWNLTFQEFGNSELLELKYFQTQFENFGI